MRVPRPLRLAYIGVGSNLNDPVRQVRAAIVGLRELPHTRVTEASSLYRTAPVGAADQPDFVNAVVTLDTGLTPHSLLEALLVIEARHGRLRGERNAARTLDLDLLLYADEVIAAPGLTLPHPRMHERAFVLLPLAEVAPQVAIPGHGPVAALLNGLAGQRVEKLDAESQAPLHCR